MTHDYLVRDVMRRCAVSDVGEYETVAAAIVWMDEYDVSALPVKTITGEYVGVLTTSNIASPRLLEKLKHTPPEKLFVKELMNRTQPVTVREDQCISEAAALMYRRNIHRVFVTDSQGHMVGVLSTTNLLRVFAVDRD